jgi:hypothetical protein
VAVAAVLIIVLTGGSTVIASSNAMPDEPLYPVKLATEDMKLAFAVSDTQKAQVHTQLAETRAVEVETMADQGKTEYAATTAERLAKQLELANSAIIMVESKAGTIPLPTVPEEQPPVTEEQPTVTEEQPTVTEEQPQVTEEQPTVTEEQPQVTEEQPTVTEEQPQVTEEQPQVTEEQPTPPTFTTRDKGATTRTERFKKSLESSTSKSLKALETAMEKAPPQAKPDWQRAINIISERNKDGTRNWNNWHRDNDKDKGKDDNEPAPVGPDQTTPQSDNTTWNQVEPNPFSPSNNQPYSSESQNTGNKDWQFNNSQTNWPNKGAAK